MSVRIALVHYAHFSFKTSVFNTIRDFTANRKNIMLMISHQNYLVINCNLM